MSDRRFPFPSRRSLTVLIVAALLAGGGLALAGFATRGGGDDVVLDVESATADAAPSTVAPRITQAPAVPDSAPTAPTDSLSPLAALVGPRSSAIPEPVEPRPLPIGIEIDAIDVSSFPIRPIGLEPDGQMEIPDETEIGWYRFGASAGRE